MTRDELLQNVWDIHGLHSSNHTLNKYLSELRKHFKNFGVTSECIATIPRIGFMFNGDVEVQVIADGQQDTGSEKNLDSNTDNSVNGGTKKTYVSFISSRLFISAAIALGVIATGIHFIPADFLHQENCLSERYIIPVSGF